MDDLFDLFGLNYIPGSLQEYFPYFMKCLVMFFVVIFVIDLFYAFARMINRKN